MVQKDFKTGAVMENKKSIYETLSKVNVEEFVKGKNGHRFLSWSHAVAQLLKHYPDAIWNHTMFNGKPYLQTESGCFVEVNVQINEIVRSQLHPILDFRNKPVMKPDAFQVNTSLQRALAKAISLHGLGLYIYQGEDLPMSEKEAMEDSRLELVNLLKSNGKYSNEAARLISSMNYDQLQEKIAEYRSK